MKKTMIDSPCISVCVLDESDMCLGCFRTLEEIGCWSTLSDDEKKMIIDLSLQRQQRDTA